jgi:hypothetical protein
VLVLVPLDRALNAALAGWVTRFEVLSSCHLVVEHQVDWSSVEAKVGVMSFGVSPHLLIPA